MQPQRPTKQSGFSAIEALLIVFVIAALVVTGLVAYQRHKPISTKNSVATSTTQTTTQPQSTVTTQPAQPDVYANWKTYCDTFYHYCFKYPPDWSMQAGDTPTSYCESRQVTLLDPAKDIAVYYVNTDSHDNGLFTIHPVSITNLSSANQALSVIGSYIAVSGPPNTNGLAGNDVPSYRIYDTSVLSQYPLVVGQPAQFPSRGIFTDKNTGSSSRTGSFMARPTFSVNTVTDAQAWFDSTSAKTSLLILKSFYYQSQQ